MTQSVSGLNQTDLEKIRRLKGLYQSDNPSLSYSNKDAVINAVEAELERLE